MKLRTRRRAIRAWNTLRTFTFPAALCAAYAAGAAFAALTEYLP